MAARFAALMLLGPVFVSAPLPEAGMLWAAEGTGMNGPTSNLLAPRCDRDLATSRYYVAKRDYTAAVGRFKIMVQKCPRSPDTPEALAFLTERYLAHGTGAYRPAPGERVAVIVSGGNTAAVNFDATY